MNHRLSVELNCPLPSLDFDVITMGHGSGGMLTHRLLESGVFDLLKNDPPGLPLTITLIVWACVINDNIIIDKKINIFIFFPF